MAISQIGTASISGLGYGFKNRLINGAMAIDQRNAGASYSLNAAAGYSTDRYQFYTGQAGTSQRISTGNLDFPYATKIQRTAGQTGTGAVQLGQVIETNNCQDLAGQTCTLSVYLTAGANFSGASSQIYVGVVTGSGVDQGAAAGLNTGTWTNWANSLNTLQTITTTRTRYTFNVSIPAGTQEVGVRFYFIPTGTAGADDSVTITGVQLEAGTVATTFDYRPYGTELALCQRYYQQVDTGSPALAAGYFGSTASGNPVYFVLNFPVAFRTSPTITTSNLNTNAGLTISSITGYSVSAFVALANAGSTLNNAYLFFNYKASAEL